MCYGLAVHLGERNHDVSIPVVQGFDPSADNVTAESVYTKRSFALDQKARALWHLCSARSTDITHFFFGLTPVTASVLGLVARIRCRVSVVTLTHVPKPGTPPAAFGDCVVTYSAYSANLLRRSGIEHVTHIPPGVDAQFFHPGASGDGANDMLGIPADVPVVLYAGGFDRSATIGAMMGAIPLCIANRPRLRFVLACRIRSADERVRQREVMRLSRTRAWGGNLVVREVVPDMRSLIARADVCILPLRDTWGKLDLPLFLLEAMAMCKPIVITDIAPLNELLQAPVGLTVRPYDAEALAQAIGRLLVDGRRYGTTGRRVVEEKYSMRRIAQRYERLYLELLDARHPAAL